MASFTIDMQQWADKTKQSIGDGVRKVVMTAAGFVNNRSPVGDKDLWTKEFIDVANKLGWIADSGKGYIGGHFRANNQYGFGSAPTGEVAGVDPDGSATLAAIRAGVYAAPVAGLHFIVNNTPYARALENGHSTQAPQGIYGLATIDAATMMRSMM